ncbi:Fatty acid hydroxylase domain-containing protein [Madurella fahalii]|uniref:Fatty acid hydroxylase domain-containing protein n=1 Tax=Madurella fahalii TaxID=1157608 RepID=A0ABQ0GFG0_9PEZI
MDILLSLPILSYFTSASLTSWSTSLNLLFFYMTWSTLVLSHNPIKIEIVGTTALRIALWLVPSLFFLAFDALLPSLSESLKFKGASALPPRNTKSLAKPAGLALLNLTLETALEAAVSVVLATVLKTPVFRTSTTLPLPWQMIKHISLLFAAREVLTYYIHRHLLHGQPAPSVPVRQRRPDGGRLARLHGASPPHARAAPPFSLLAKADHPGPHLLHRFLPVYLPALLLHPAGLHLLTYLVFVALATLEETLAMSGYAVIPGIVMGGIARRTAVHHCGGGGSSGNFGNWGVLDWAHGTSLGRDVVGDLHAEAGKHALKERAEGAVDDAGGALRGGMEGLRKGRKASSGVRKGGRNGSGGE